MLTCWLSNQQANSTNTLTTSQIHSRNLLLTQHVQHCEMLLPCSDAVLWSLHKSDFGSGTRYRVSLDQSFRSALWRRFTARLCVQGPIRGHVWHQISKDGLHRSTPTLGSRPDLGPGLTPKRLCSLSLSVSVQVHHMLDLFHFGSVCWKWFMCVRLQIVWKQSGPGTWFL